MNNASVVYFTSEFGLSTEDAALLGFAYGSMNLFARALGGLYSDRLSMAYGMRGRLWLTSALLLCEGSLMLVFAYADHRGGAIAAMCCFSLFTQSAEGAIFGIVPYISKLYTGSVSGLVGSGGNMGSMVYGLGFRSLNYQQGFVMMGSIVMASSVLSIGINIPCHAQMLWGQDNHAVIRARERFARRRQRDFLEDSINRHRTGRPPQPSQLPVDGDLEMNPPTANSAENPQAGPLIDS